MKGTVRRRAGSNKSSNQFGDISNCGGIGPDTDKYCSVMSSSLRIIISMFPLLPAFPEINLRAVGIPTEYRHVV